MSRRRGSALLEFTFVGVPVVFLTISIVTAAIGAWQFTTMEYAIQVTNRYISTHGRGCSQNGNSCTLTLGQVTTMISQQALALDGSKLSVTLTTASSSRTCNPINTCTSSSDQFPSSTDNGVNQDVTILATYPIANPAIIFWPGAGRSSAGGYFNLSATTRQRIQF